MPNERKNPIDDGVCPHRGPVPRNPPWGWVRCDGGDDDQPKIPGNRPLRTQTCVAKWRFLLCPERGAAMSELVRVSVAPKEAGISHGALKAAIRSGDLQVYRSAADRR